MSRVERVARSLSFLTGEPLWLCRRVSRGILLAGFPQVVVAGSAPESLELDNVPVSVESAAEQIAAARKRIEEAGAAA